MGDVFNQGIHQMLSPGVCIMTLNILLRPLTWVSLSPAGVVVHSTEIIVNPSITTTYLGEFVSCWCCRTTEQRYNCKPFYYNHLPG